MDNKAHREKRPAQPGMNDGRIENVEGEGGGRQSQTDRHRNGMNQATMHGKSIKQGKQAIANQQKTTEPQDNQFRE